MGLTGVDVAQATAVQHVTLDRGLTLIHQYVPATPVVVADVWVRAGAIAEPPRWQGMAHFLEHMIFKGTKNLAPGAFDYLIEAQGAMTNAATSHDYAHFYLTTAARNVTTTLPHLADLLLGATIPDGEFYKERDVVMEEIRGSYDDPDWLSFQALCRSLYPHHPYGRSVLGELEDVLRHTPNQMRCFHQTYYQPENMAVVVVGGVEFPQVEDLVGAAFADFAVRSECPPVLLETDPPLIQVRRTEMVLPELEQARLTMGWVGPGVDCLEDAIGLDLLSMVIAGSQTCPLVQELREARQWVFDVVGGFSLQRDSSLFTLGAWLPSSHLDAVERWIAEYLDGLAQRPVAMDLWQRSRRLLLNDYIFSTETPGQLAGMYGYYHTLADWDWARRYPEILRRWTPDRLCTLVRRYLAPDRYGIAVLRPASGGG